MAESDFLLGAGGWGPALSLVEGLGAGRSLWDLSGAELDGVAFELSSFSLSPFSSCAELAEVIFASFADKKQR